MSWSSIPSNPALNTVLHVGSPYEGGIQFAFDSTGDNGVIAWVEQVGGSQGTYAMRLVDGVWGSREQVYAPEPQTHNVVAALIDDSGAPCLALSRGGWYFATIHRYDSGSWSQVGSEFGGSGGAATGIDFISTGEPEVCQMVGYGGTNNRSVMIFFKSRDGLRIARTINGATQGTTLLNGTSFGATIGNLIKVSTTEFHAIGRLSDNRIAHWSSTDAGATWSTATIIASGSDVGSDVRASLQGDGSILAVWSLTSGSGATKWSLYSGSAWSAPDTVTGPAAAITSGNVHFSGDTLTYGKDVAGTTQICATQFASGSWEAEQQLTDEASSVTLHGFGCSGDGIEAAIAWQTSGSFYTRRRVGGNWRTGTESFANANFYPQVVAGDSTLGIHSGLTPQAMTLDASIPQTINAQAGVVSMVMTFGLAVEANFTSTTDDYETAIGNAILRGQPLTGPATVYAALFTDYPGEDGSQVAEVSGNGYERTAIAFSESATVGVFTNSSTCLFPEATGSGWGTLTHIGLMDAQTGGLMIMSFPIVDESGNGITQDIGAGDRPEIAAGDLTATIN